MRGGKMVTRSEGVTRSGAIGLESGVSGVGSVGNSITAITGSTFGVGQFDIEVYDVQSAQQRKVESTISFRDGNGAVIDRTLSMAGTSAADSIVLNGTFVEGNYTGGVSLDSGDTITLTGTNADGTTFQGSYTFTLGDDSVNSTYNDFKFASISGLVEEMNYRTRDYSGTDLDGTQTRFEDAIFTFTSNGTLMLFDDMARSNSQTNFTLTIENRTTNPVHNFTFQDDAALVQEGFAEQATFRIQGGTELRAEAGDVITLHGEQSTMEGVPQPQVTFRVGSDLTAGIDKLETTPDKFTGALNGGAQVTFSAGDQDVVFIDGNSGGNKGVSRFMTVDFDSTIDVTARTDGLPDTGRTLVLSTNNSSLNFHIGAYADQDFRAAIGDLTAENLGFGRGSGRVVADIDVTTIEGANEAMRIIDEALDQVNKTRSILGAATNRLESTINNLSVSSENLSASESRIRDADIAKETTQYTKNQVLLQAGVSVLAQANFQSQNFLSLIG
jgi:flagellin-like hook-associated protein FlgL